MASPNEDTLHAPKSNANLTYICTWINSLCLQSTVPSFYETVQSDEIDGCYKESAVTACQMMSNDRLARNKKTERLDSW